jgi:hypothetical protein
MSDEKYLKLEDGVAEWLKAREDETTGDICFSAVVLDLFHGFSPDATRYETKVVGDRFAGVRNSKLINGTCYLVQQMLLTQSQLQTKWAELHWWMSGDKYDPEGKGRRFPSALYSSVDEDAFRFAYDFTDFAGSSYGSVVLPSEVL